jgi:hypothetical protein
MGYAATSTDVPSVKRALIEVVPIFIGYIPADTGTYATLYKAELNLTDVDYLKVTFYKQTTAHFKLTIGGVTKIENTTGGSATWYDYTIDCTGISGLQYIEILTKYVTSQSYITEFTMWGRES